MERLISRIKYRKELFTIYHPQTDERTEKTNQSVEKRLRIHCNHFQNDWVKCIFMVEFNYNKTFSIILNDDFFILMKTATPLWVSTPTPRIMDLFANVYWTPRPKT